MTAILSACSTVLSLWAMTMTVRWCPKRSDHRACSKALEISMLDSGSKADVGSSSISTDGSRMRARAMAIRWRWPPDKSLVSETTVL
mmetsp:Transcript_13978/g.25214  ORF Transcript_13978/g.25214 Transcript_13978/m.25214 type:complete len:87 (-) Transcript_13978:489-749(-)